MVVVDGGCIFRRSSRRWWGRTRRRGRARGDRILCDWLFFSFFFFLFSQIHVGASHMRKSSFSRRNHYSSTVQQFACRGLYNPSCSSHVNYTAFAATLSDAMAPPAPKRRRTQSASNLDSDLEGLVDPLPHHEDRTDISTFMTISQHPLNLKPSGNAYTASSNLRDTSIGLFAALPDELILDLLGHLDSRSLNALGSTSRGFFAFAYHDELWRLLFIRYAFSRFVPSPVSVKLN